MAGRKHIAGEAGFDTLPVLAVANEVTIAGIPEQAGEVTEQLENIAANIGAGAVIAGAYGHSRLREWVLSGVTRHLATQSRRCAFLSR
jgi:nucleotide-binding universal stress UspA family protein